jgi:GT2 family glycosyltransferase
MFDSTHPLVSVVILNFNGKKFLNKCLSTVLASEQLNFEVILVDNASKDGSTEIAQANFPQSNLMIIRNGKNLGFAEGNNIGARIARGKYVVFLNNDTEVEKEWLKELVEVMQSDETIGAAQSKLLSFDRKTIDSKGDFINSYGMGWMRGLGEEDKLQYDKKTEIFSARGASMIVRKQILHEVGYFDSDFFMLYEDIDLCWRIRLSGYKVSYVPKSIVYHFGSGTSKEDFSREESNYYEIRNRIFTLIKNYDLQNLLINGIKTLSVEFALFLIVFFSPSRRYNLSRIKAHLWIVLNFGCIWRKRLTFQSLKRKVPDEKIKRLMIKGNSPFLRTIWYIFYKNKVDYNHFLNETVIFKNKWVS